MKKNVSYALSVALLAVGMASCAKSTKGKVTNEWKVVSSLQTHSYSEGDYSENSTTNMTENSFSQQSVHTDDGITTVSNYVGSVTENSFTIKKDGTWSSKEDMTYTFDNDEQQHNITEKSGTWSFVGRTKGDDFKKNERILFNVLTKKLSSTQIYNQTVSSQYTDSDTYLTGERVEIYTIKESKKKELELEMVNTLSNSSDSGLHTENESVTMTLQEK